MYLKKCCFLVLKFCLAESRRWAYGAVDRLCTHNSPSGLVFQHSYRNHPAFLMKFVIEVANAIKNITKNLCGLLNLLCLSKLTSSSVSYIKAFTGYIKHKLCDVLDS